MASRLSENFESGLGAYEAISGSLGDFSTTSSPYGANCLLAASATLGTASAARREFTSRALNSFSTKFNIASLQDNDACIVQLREGSDIKLAFNPRPQGVGSPVGVRRATLTLDSETVYASAVDLDEDTWYTVHVSVVPGPGNSSFIVYDSDSALEIFSGSFASDHVPQTVDGLVYYIDSGSATCATMYDDTTVNPDTTELPEIIPPFMSVTHAFECKGIFVNTAMAQGSARKRRRYTSVPPIYQVTWDLSQAQMTALDNWYEDDLLAGSETFDVEIAVPGGVETHNAQWIEPYTATPNEIERWVVTGKLLIDGAAGRGQVAARIPLNYVASIIEAANATDWSLAAWPVFQTESLSASDASNWEAIELFLVEEHANATDTSNTIGSNTVHHTESTTASSTQNAGFNLTAARSESVTASEVSDGSVTGSVYLTNTTSLWGAYGLQRLISGYSGNCIKVRRSSDNATQDIGFSGDALDAASIISFLGGSPAGDAYVDTWYDQSGGSHDLVQATTSKQPIIVDAGEVLDHVYFDGVNDLMSTSASGTNPTTAATVHMLGRGRVANLATVNEYLWANGINYGLQQLQAGAFDSGIRFVGSHEAGNLQYFQHASGVGMTLPSTEDATVNSVCIDRSGTVNLSNEIKVYINANLQTANAATGSTAPTNGTPGVFTLGADTTDAYWARLAARTVLYYEAYHDQTATTGVVNEVLAPRAIGALDNHTSNLWAAYSLRKTRTAYAGYCMKVRRDSDNTTQDIGFAADGMYDTAALVSFCTAASGYVDTFYDQSGNGNHLVQATSGNQPRVVSGGALQHYIDFDYGDDYMATPNNSGTPSAFTTFFRARQDAYGVQQWPMHDAGGSNFFSWYFDSGSTPFKMAGQLNNGAGGVIDNSFPMFSAGQVLAMKTDRAASGTTKVRAYSGGVELTATNRTNTGSISGNFPAAPWQISSTVVPVSIFLHTWVIYEAALSDTDIDRISRGLG